MHEQSAACHEATAATWEAQGDAPWAELERRCAALEHEFASDPSLFGRYKDNVADATPLAASSGPRRTTTAAHGGTTRTAARHNQPFGPGSGYKF